MCFKQLHNDDARITDKYSVDKSRPCCKKMTDKLCVNFITKLDFKPRFIIHLTTTEIHPPLNHLAYSEVARQLLLSVSIIQERSLCQLWRNSMCIKKKRKKNQDIVQNKATKQWNYQSYKPSEMEGQTLKYHP